MANDHSKGLVPTQYGREQGHDFSVCTGQMHSDSK
jgi:hypothetical protein